MKFPGTQLLSATARTDKSNTKKRYRLKRMPYIQSMTRIKGGAISSNTCGTQVTETLEQTKNDEFKK
jgi:hypothetical protein